MSLMYSYLSHNQSHNPSLSDSLTSVSNQRDRSQFTQDLCSSFNGIIFRQRQLLDQLGVYQSMQKQEAAMPAITRKLRQTCLSISVRLSFETTLKWNAKIALTEYQESFLANIKFVYLQRNYSFSGHQFVKINIVAQDVSKTIKILLSNKSYSQVVRTLNSRQIKYYIKPTSSFLAYYCQNNFTLSQLCSSTSGISLQPFDDRIQYASPCTFNGKQNCFVVFTATKALVFHNRDLLKQINKEACIQKEYWIECKEDWISFERQDHSLVFQQKLEEVSLRNAGIQYTSLNHLQSEESLQETIKKQSIFTKQTSNIWQSDIKEMPTIKQNFMSEQIQYRQSIFSDIEQQPMRRQLFNGEQAIIDESDAVKEQMEERQQIMVDQSVFSINDNQSEEKEEKMEGLDQEIAQEVDQVEVPNEEKKKSKRDQEDNCQFNYNTCHSTLSLFSQNQPQEEQPPLKIIAREGIQKMTFFEQRAIERLNLKENSKNFLNNGANTQVQHSNGHNDELESQEQYVYQPKQCLINLSNKIQEFSSCHNVLENNSPVFEEKPKRQKMAILWPIIDVCQISSTTLAGLSTQNEVFLFQQLGSLAYHQQGQSIKGVSKIFGGRQQSCLYYSNQKSGNINLLNVQSMYREQISTTFLKGKEIKDVKALNNNDLTILTDNSIQIVDRRVYNGTQGINFKSTQLFEKIDIHQSTAIVGRNDGLVKLYDLRSLKPKSLNNFDLNSELNQKYPQSLRQLKILDNLNVFCQYKNSAFIIDAEKRGQKNIYNSKLKNAERSFVQQFSINPQILYSIDMLDQSFGEVCFSTNRFGTSVMSFYKGYEFNFDLKSEKIKHWNKIDTYEDYRCLYAGLGSLNGVEKKIYGYDSKEGYLFQEAQRQ